MHINSSSCRRVVFSTLLHIRRARRFCRQATTSCSNHKTSPASTTPNRSRSALVRPRKSRTTLRPSRSLQNCSPKYATGYLLYWLFQLLTTSLDSLSLADCRFSRLPEQSPAELRLFMASVVAGAHDKPISHRKLAQMSFLVLTLKTVSVS